jgi:hypothetical protein
MALSQRDRTSLSQAGQDEIRRATAQYEAARAANDAAGMAAAHRAAEKVRAAAGYSGGADGVSSAAPTRTAAQMKQYADDYMARNYDPGRGFVNGFSGPVNGRSIANAIRQQMLENTRGWRKAGSQAEKDSLHEENVRLAALLRDQTGGAESVYNEKTGEWTTTNGNSGYGRVVPGDVRQLKALYGYTDADIEKYFGGQQSDRYRNFVDYTQLRRDVDGSSGFTGRYANAVQGPEGSLLAGGTRQYGRAGEELPVQPRPSVEDGGSGFLSRIKNGVVVTGSGTDARLRGGAGPAGAAEGASGGAADSALSGARDAGARQAAGEIDFATNQAVQKLLRARREAEDRYAEQRRQAAYDERQGLDNSALYAELRGDDGGVGRAQYDAVQAEAAGRRQTIADAQTRLAYDTQEKIASLRAEGEYKKADRLLALTQTYLKELSDMQKWAAEYNLSQQKLAQSVREWQSEFALKKANLMGSYEGEQTLAGRKFAAAQALAAQRKR